MNKQPHTIHNILSSWGRSQQLPDANENIKNTILNHLPTNPEPAVSPSPVRRWWLPVTATGLAVFSLIFFVSQRTSLNLGNLGGQIYPSSYSTMMSDSAKSQESSAGARMDQSVSSFVNPTTPMPSPPYQQPEIPITDTRQFLKTDYSATIKTRKPQETTSRIQTMIRGYEGRIDRISNSTEFGSISFVVPASKLDAFRAELAQLVGSRFIIEQTNSQNLLAQKQTLEEDRTNTQTSLTDVTAKRDQLTTTHNQTINFIQSKLNANISQEERNNLNAQLSKENSTYQNQLNGFNNQIQNLQNNLNNINKQDGQLTETVATVSGTISLSKMSLFELTGFYLPNYWLVYLSILALIVAYFLDRRRDKWIV